MTSLGSILWFLAIGGLFYYIMRKGSGYYGSPDHGGHVWHAQHEEGADHGEHNSHEKPALLNIEEQANKDPVYGMEVDEKKEFSAVRTWDGLSGSARIAAGNYLT